MKHGLSLITGGRASDLLLTMLPKLFHHESSHG